MMIAATFSYISFFDASIFFKKSRVFNSL
jgi:hypothetical protein